tara:strand:+ start:769 stop:1230 length:462 start_codon:yes stop_codon:yes gene_type:complete
MKTTSLVIFIYTFLLALAVHFDLHARNEYLNNGTNECRYGDVDLSISKRERDQDYRTSNNSDYDDDSHELRLSFRKYLGISKKDCEMRNAIQSRNEQLKQQIELYKVCKGINTKQDLPNFKELLLYCQGVKNTDNKPRHNPYKEMINKIDEVK